MEVTISIWELLESIYGEMTQSKTDPSQIAGDFFSPVNDILAQINSGDPNWTTIEESLVKLQSELSEMVAVGGNIYPVSAPNFPELLKSTEAMVGTLFNDLNNPSQFEADFGSFLDHLSSIRQDLLQGQSGDLLLK